MSQQQEIDLFWQYTVRAIDDVIACLDEAPVEEWNWKPVETANSLFVLAIHVMGSTAEHLLEGICGEPVGRQRDTEFVSAGTDAAPIRAEWESLQARISEGLDALPAGALDAECNDPRLGTMPARKILLIVAQHVAEHRGHAQLTLDLLTAKLGKTPQLR
jgi:uncharacterized damage-inducible protein DinB